MSTLLPLLFAIAALLLVWRLFTSLFQTEQPAEPTDEVEDPLEPVPAPRNTGLKVKPGRWLLRSRTMTNRKIASLHGRYSNEFFSVPLCLRGEIIISRDHFSRN
jgi:hypothetical protein